MKNRLMKARRLAAIYGFSVFIGLVACLLLTLPLMPYLGASPTRNIFTPIFLTPSTERDTRVPIGSNNYSASNANAIYGSRGRSLSGTPVPPDYSTLAPAKPISQTAHGYTVILYPMYANANLIVMTYTVRSMYEDLSKVSPWEPLRGEEQRVAEVSTPNSDDGSLRPLPSSPIPTAEAYEPRLFGDNGHAFPWLRSAYLQIRPDITSELLIFDAGQLAESL